MNQPGSLVDPENVCPDHGSEELTTYRSTSRGKPFVRTYCRACRRSRERRLGITKYTRIGSTRCRNGHLKLPWTWKRYNGAFRCLTCQYEGEKRARDRRSAAA